MGSSGDQGNKICKIYPGGSPKIPGGDTPAGQYPDDCISPVSAPFTTKDPLFLRYGSVYEKATDLNIPAAGMNWALMRSYSSKGVGVTCLGNRWLSTLNDMRLTFGSYVNSNGPGTIITLIVNAGSQRVWDSQTLALSPPDSLLKMTHSGTNYVLTDVTKNMRYLFDGTNGRLLEQSTLQLNSQSVAATTYSYNANGTVSQITTSAGQDYGVFCTYSTSNPTLLTQVQVKDTSANVLQQVNYTYYQDVTSPSADIGTTNDLVQVKVSRRDSSGSLSIIRYTQYRYGSGSLVKAVYEHDDIQRMMSALSLSTPESVMSQTDTFGTPKVNTFPSRSFTYYSSAVSTSAVNTAFATAENLNTTYGGSEFDETGCVASETTNGCGSCNTAGSVTKNYYYTIQSTMGGSNGVSYIIVEDTLDSGGTGTSRTVYGFEVSGRLLRRAIIQNPVTSPVFWCESWTFSTYPTQNYYLLGAHRNPSAHTGITTAANLRTFLNPFDGTSWANDTATVNTSSGLIETHTYNVNAQRTDSFVQMGSSGTPYYVAAYDYGDTTNPYLITATYEYPTKTATRSAGVQRSYSYTFYDATYHQQMKVRTTTWPTISTTQNGSGVATTTSEYFDNLGRLRWTKDGEGYVNYYSYNPVTGGLAYIAIDVDPSSPGSEITSGSAGNWDAVTVAGASSNAPTRGASLPSVLQLTRKAYFDAQGRCTQITDAAGASHYAVYTNSQTIQFPYWNGTNQCALPAIITKFNSGGQVSDRIEVRASYTAFSTSSGAPTGFSTSPSQSDYVRWTRATYDAIGRLSYVDNYASIPSSGSGTLGTDFYRNIKQYDTLGRQQYGVQVIKGSASNNRVEQVVKYDYDVLDRIVSVSAGVSGDTAANSHDMTDNYNAYPTVRTLSQIVYDNGGVGDGNVTKTRRFFGTGSTDYTGANYKRTYRGDLRGVEPFYISSGVETVVGPYPVFDLNWNGNATTSALYDTTPTWATVLTGDGYSAYASSTSTNRRTQQDTLYDDLGRVYQLKQYKISASTGTGTNYVSRKNYFDRIGQLVATAKDFGSGTEIAYDGAGRAYQSRTVMALQSTPYSSGAFNYNAPAPKIFLSSMSGGDAGVLTIRHQAFDTSGNVTKVDVFEDNHDDVTGASKGINLTNNNDYVRRTVFNWYDTANRLTVSADFGSGDTAAGAGQWKYAAMPTRPVPAPTASSNTALVSLQTYNGASGLTETLIDPSGTTNKLFYDRLGRRTYVAENFSDFNASTEAGTGDATDKSKDKVTKWIYDGPSRLKQLVAMDANADGSLADNQATTYLYEDAVSAALQTNAIYPDSSDTTSSGTDQVKLTYNVDGSLSQRTDQRGTVIGYSYSNTRLPSIQSVTTLGSGVDGSVRSIARTYDNLQRLQNITSYASTGGTGTVVNDVQFALNDFSQVTSTYQSHSGAVNTSTTPNVQQAYDTTTSGSVFSARHRRQSITYPNGRVIYYDYGTSGGAYDVLSEVRTIWDTSTSGTALATYDFNGAGSTLAVKTLPQPSLKLDYFQGTSGAYAGLDRFGRVADHYWKGYGTTPDRDRFHYAYDYSSSRTYKDLDAAIYSGNNRDEAYTYDGLHRLGNRKTGTLSSGSISGTPASEENWGLDALGNWASFLTKASGTTNLSQTRTANAVNEISGISTSTGTAWAAPAYDAAGNMTTIPKPLALNTTFTATYDAWNRLVSVVDTSTSQNVQQYQYDGRNFRTVVKTYTSGTLSETRDFFYTDDWRVVEERVTSGTMERQYVWGSQYIDELVSVDKNGVRRYPLQDANWNTTTFVDSSGSPLEHYVYNAYGQPSTLDGVFTQTSSQASTLSFDYFFAGYRVDKLTGLFQVRNRMYHPSVGVWVQRDPLEYADSSNHYQYAQSDPAGAIDPIGTFPWKDVTVTYDDGENITTEVFSVDFGTNNSLVDDIKRAITLEKMGNGCCGPIGILNPKIISFTVGGDTPVTGTPPLIPGGGGGGRGGAGRRVNCIDLQVGMSKPSQKANTGVTSGFGPNPTGRTAPISGGKPARIKGERMKSGDNALQQLEEIEQAQQKVRQVRVPR